MSKPQIGCDAWMDENPDRYAIYPAPVDGWHITSNMQHVDTCSTLHEAMDAAHAHAEARATLAPTC